MSQSMFIRTAALLPAVLGTVLLLVSCVPQAEVQSSFPAGLFDDLRSLQVSNGLFRDPAVDPTLGHWPGVRTQHENGDEQATIQGAREVSTTFKVARILGVEFSKISTEDTKKSLTKFLDSNAKGSDDIATLQAIASLKLSGGEEWQRYRERFQGFPMPPDGSVVSQDELVIMIRVIELRRIIDPASATSVSRQEPTTLRCPRSQALAW